MIKELTYDDIYKIIDEHVSNEKDMEILMTGENIKSIIDYIEVEHGMDEAETDEYYDELSRFKIYSLYLSVNDDLHYYLDEAYFNGVLLENDEYGKNDVYVDVSLKFRDDDLESRVHGNKIMFSLVKEHSKDNKKEIETINNKALLGECEYIINGRNVTKEEYDKVSKEIDESWNKLKEEFKTPFSLLEYFEKYI